jgi:hypothetical protein
MNIELELKICIKSRKVYINTNSTYNIGHLHFEMYLRDILLRTNNANSRYLFMWVWVFSYPCECDVVLHDEFGEIENSAHCGHIQIECEMMLLDIHTSEPSSIYSHVDENNEQY